ncbi:MAG: DUF5678 domain-containing protein [Candidatus Peregrinibacteria bacterium]|nr:DUF5678 domain-containing protein [Candidatus Peregrinibacteria bacterium]MDZ4244848.1 DUF5678 domain-containing protein [Candidatus Gracilibacteria bacterium]
MVKTPKISAALQQKHTGKVVISLDGKVVALGKTTTSAYSNAKKKMPNIDDKEFLVSRIHHKYLAA